MTYGENGEAIRTGLTTLLRQHRVQHRLSGKPDALKNSALRRRQDYGAQVRRYRQGILVWCHQATVAADPYLGANEFVDHHNGNVADGPYDLLRTGLKRAIDASTAPLPPLEELSTAHEVELVETWRQIASAAAIGEHDFYAGAGHGMLDATQCHTVMKDVAAVVQALVILDHRYRSVPGWETLSRVGGLGWSALATGLEASIGPPDYTVDHRGWRPPLRFVRGPARPGLLGVLQAEQNLLVRLADSIAPTNLRLAVSAQVAVSADLSKRTAHAELRARWQARAETYELIGRSLRDVAPRRSSKGASAAGEANNVIARLVSLPDDTMPDDKMLAAFDKRFTAVDTRIADLIETGILNKTILRRAKVPLIDANSSSLVKPLRERFGPIQHAGDSDLLGLVGTRLRRTQESVESAKTGARNRAELYAAIAIEAPAHMRR